MSLSWLIDVAVIPGAKLDDEIRVDRNWGAAIVVGCMKLGVTVLLNTFLPRKHVRTRLTVSESVLVWR